MTGRTEIDGIDTRGAASFGFATPRNVAENATQHARNVNLIADCERAESSTRVRVDSIDPHISVHTLKRVLGEALR